MPAPLSITCMVTLCLLSPLQLMTFAAPATPEHRPITENLIQSLTAEAASRHQAIRASQALVEAAGYDRSSIRSWEDPTLKLGGTVSGFRGPNLREDGDLSYGLEQPLPLFGKPAAARRVASAQEGVAAATLAAERSQLRKSIHLSLLRIATAQQRITTSEEELLQLQTWISNAEQRFSSGTGSQIEVLRLQNELSLRTESIRSERDLLSHEFATLNRALNLPLDGPHSQDRFMLPEIPAQPLPQAQWTDLALAREPQLQILQHQLQAAQSQVDLVSRQRFPEVALGVDGRQYTGDGGFREGSFTLAFKFPWFNQSKYRSDRLRERARQTAVEATIADREWTIREQLHHLWVDLETLRRRNLLYQNELIPRTRQAVQAAHIAWVGNRGMFQDLMEGRRMLREAVLEQLRTQSEFHTQLAELQYLTGQPLLFAGKSSSVPNTHHHNPSAQP